MSEYLSVSDLIDLGTLEALVGRDSLVENEQNGRIEIVVDARRRSARLAQPLIGEVLRHQLGELGVRERAREILVAMHRRDRNEDDARAAWLEMLAGEPSDTAHLLDAARSRRASHDWNAAERLARAAVAAGGGAAAVLELAECLYWSGRHAEMIELLEDADFSQAPDSERSDRWRNLASAWFWGLGRHEMAWQCAERGLAAISTPETQAEIYGQRAEMKMFSARHREAIADGELVAPDEKAPIRARLNAFSGLVPALALSGRELDALAQAETGLALIAEHPELVNEGAGSFIGLCLAQMFTGAFEELDATLNALYNESLLHPTDPLRGTWALFLGRSAHAQGRLDLAVARLRESLALLQQDDPARARFWCAALLAEALAMQGHAELAIAAMAEADSARLPSVQCYDGELMLARAWTAVAQGDVVAAREQLVSMATSSIERGAGAVAALALFDAMRVGVRGLTGYWDELAPMLQGEFFAEMERATRAVEDGSAALIDASAAALSRYGASLWAAELHMMAGRRFRKAGEMAEAERAFAAGRVLAAEAGWPTTPALRDVAPESRELTVREREIADLVARGGSNRQIATQLHLSVRTVENHVARIYGKLGLKNRLELARVLDAPGDREGTFEP